VILLPVYDGIKGTGSNITYHLSGFAAFVLTGYKFSGESQPSWLSGNDLCHGQEKCLYGYFTKALVPGTGTIGGADLGALVVQLIG